MAIENEPTRKGEQAYIRGPDCIPIYVGEGVGAMDYDDAVELAALHMVSSGKSQSYEAAISEIMSKIVPPRIKRTNPPKRQKEQWRDYRGTSRKTDYTFRASKNNPYICDHCGRRTTRYGNMISHLEKVHGDYATDPRKKSIAVQEGIVEILKEWDAL